MDEYSKNFAQAKAEPSYEDVDDRQPDASEKYNPHADRHDMQRLGRVQEVRRRFRFFSIVGYMVILASTWESVLINSVFSLSNGGTAGAIWLTLVACFGMLLSTLSMAEVDSHLIAHAWRDANDLKMASISPTAGG